jgi:hypothetical protein
MVNSYDEYLNQNKTIDQLLWEVDDDQEKSFWC